MYDVKRAIASEKSVKVFMFHVIDRNDGHRMDMCSSRNETTPRPDSDGLYIHAYTVISYRTDIGQRLRIGFERAVVR